jgi:poly(3-hydroxybutyrate) depolymerase
MVPLADGSFDLDDYIDYLIEILHFLGEDVHVIGVCQPAVPVIAAAALMEAAGDRFAPRSMTLMGGPIDTRINPTAVNELATGKSLDWFAENVVMKVPFPHPGAMRDVYPGSMQLSAFMAMNPARHAKAFRNQWLDIATHQDAKVARHNAFYDEYLAVMDMTAEFYLSTVERIFKNKEVARDVFTLHGEPVSLAAMRRTPLFVIEGGRDDVAAPGQCAAALDLTANLPRRLKRRHVEPDAGHYAIFSGSRWRNAIAPKILDFINRQDAARGV